VPRFLIRHLDLLREISFPQCNAAFTELVLPKCLRLVFLLTELNLINNTWIAKCKVLVEKEHTCSEIEGE
jgi:hypothetical protein